MVYVLVTWDHSLAGDEPEYHMQAAFLADGKWFWSDTPYGIPHPSAWKTPGYPLFVGILYAIGGKNPDAVMLLQVLVLGPLTITLTWLLGRRLFGAGSARRAAFVAAAASVRVAVRGAPLRRGARRPAHARDPAARPRPQTADAGCRLAAARSRAC